MTSTASSSTSVSDPAMLELLDKSWMSKSSSLTRAKDRRCAGRGSNDSSKCKGLPAARAALAATRPAAVALVGEGGDQCEDETEDGDGKDKAKIDAL